MTIAENLNQIKNSIPKSVRLVAITKTQSVNTVLEAYKAGQRIFGENKVQEMVPKFNQLPKDIEWHMVGHLQTNKVKYIASFVYMIHGVDSLKLLRVIDQEGSRNNRQISCLLQIKIAEEETKFGLSENEADILLNDPEIISLKNIRISGLMGMATFTEDEEVIRREFRKLQEIFNRFRTKYFSRTEYFKELSMGMSSDYRIAIEEGATYIRIGSSIFGERIYT